MCATYKISYYIERCTIRGKFLISKKLRVTCNDQQVMSNEKSKTANCVDYRFKFLGNISYLKMK